MLKFVASLKGTKNRKMKCFEVFWLMHLQGNKWTT